MYAFLIIFISHPLIYKRYSRVMRDFVRFNNGFIFGGMLIIMYQKSLIIMFITLIFLFLIKTYYNKIRNNIDICSNCKELSEGQTCSGYKFQKEALLNLEEDYCKTLLINKEDLL